MEIDGKTSYVYILKRPFCEEFIQRVSEWYEVVMFTASLSKYADPLLDWLDKYNVVRLRPGVRVGCMCVRVPVCVCVCAHVSVCVHVCVSMCP